MEEEKIDPKVKLSDKFKKERNTYSLEIKEGVQKLYNIKYIKDVQVQFLSLRQRLLEDNHTLLDHLRKANAKHKKSKSKEWERVSKGVQERYQSHEKKVLVEGSDEVVSQQELIDLIENQMSFYTESIKTVDNVLFGLKTRIDVEKMLG